MRELGNMIDNSSGVPSPALLLEHGFVRVSSEPHSALRLVSSSNSNVTMDTPHVYFDTYYFRYTAVGTYHWDGDFWEGNLGGPDAFGLRFDRKMDNRGVTGRFSGKPNTGPGTSAFGTTIVRNPSDNGSYGVAYSLQDAEYVLCCGRVDYNMYSGRVTMDVGRPACGTTTHLYSRYFHTWGSSGVTGFEISISGFGVSWSSETQHWAAASQAGTWTVNC